MGVNRIRVQLDLVSNVKHRSLSLSSLLASFVGKPCSYHGLCLLQACILPA